MLQIRIFQSSDWDRVREIYQAGVLTGNATFETTVPDYASFVEKFGDNLLWVMESEDLVVAWGGLQPVSTRKVYEGVMEIGLYVHPDFQKKGLATQLIHHIIAESENEGIWTLYAAILQENIASIKLHTAVGFREIGFREKIGRLDGKWRNTVLFERRSKKVGL